MDRLVAAAVEVVASPPPERTPWICERLSSPSLPKALTMALARLSASDETAAVDVLVVLSWAPSSDDSVSPNNPPPDVMGGGGGGRPALSAASAPSPCTLFPEASAALDAEVL